VTDIKTPEPSKDIRDGIRLVRAGDYKNGLAILSEAYAKTGEKSPDGLSYYGLCLAIVQKKYKNAVDLCKKAIEMQFYRADHYSNLSRVYLETDHKQKAIDIVEKGLKVNPEDEGLLKLRKAIGVRARPPIPFLSRSNPLNEFLGRARHAKKTPAPRKKK